MLSIVTWKWTPMPGYRSSYGPAQVNALRTMVERHYPHPHRFICVTDDAAGLDERIEVIPDWRDFADIPSPHGGRNPSCYRRLRMFHPKIAQHFGERFVSLDLDVVLTADMTPLWHRPEPIVFWGDTNPLPGSHYNGSMVLMAAGARPQVWTDFDPVTSPARSRQARCFGSDQGWISCVLGKGEARWTKRDGVYSFRNDIRRDRKLPANARIVIFHGNFDPWVLAETGYGRANWPWIAEHYPLPTGKGI